MAGLKDLTQKQRTPAWHGAVSALWPVLAALVLGALAHFVAGPLAGGFVSTVLVVIGINIILAVSLTVVNGFTGQFSIGHAGFMALGGYAGAAVVYYGSIKLFGSADFAGGLISTPTREGFTGGLVGKGDALFVASCVAGGLVAMLAGYVVGLPSLRLRGDYLAIVTLGFGEIVRVFIQGTPDQIQPWKSQEALAKPVYDLFYRVGGPKGFGSLPIYASLFWVYVFVMLTLVVVYRLKYSSAGRAFLSIREDEIAAQAMGVDITKYKVRAFVLSSFFAGLAGVLYATSIGSINASDLGFAKSFDFVTMVVLGGLGSISGSVIAAAVLTALPEVLRSPGDLLAYWYVAVIAAVVFAGAGGVFKLRSGSEWPKRLWTAAVVCLGLLGLTALAAGANTLLQKAANDPSVNIGQYRLVLYAVLLIVIMLLRPQGLLGVSEVWYVFRSTRAGGKAAARGIA